MPRSRKLISYLAKLAVSGILIWLLVIKVDFSALIRETKGIGGGYFFLAFLLLVIAWWFNTFRWKALLRIFSLDNATWKLFVYNLVSIFYNVALPGGKIMGDVVRAYQVMRDHPGSESEKRRLFLIAFIDRGVGLLALLLVASLYFVFGHPAIGYLGPNPWLVGVPLIVISILGTIFIFTGIFDGIFFALKKIPLGFTQRTIATILESLEICRTGRRQLLIAILCMVFSAGAAAASLQALAWGVGVHIPFLTIVFFNALAVVLILIPVTIAGIGLRESGLVYLLTQAGVLPEKALAISILSLFAMILLAAIGGVAELHNHFLKRRIEEAEMSR